MRHKIWNIIKNASIIFTVLLLLTFILHALAIPVNPGTQFIVGNETYTVYQTMDFHTIIVGPSYIIFNTTGFYISSENDITITLVYINDDIAGADHGEKVLEFYADTTAGSVVFDLSGFPAGNDYLVNRSGNPIDISTADGSGNISFINSAWNNYLFEIFQWGGSTGNNAPFVSDVPDQTILGGASFTQIDLDSYVFDFEDPDENISWTNSSNTELLVSIVNRVATISTPDFNWYGAETITFTAEDTDGLTDSDNATFIVIANDAPFFSDLSIRNGANDVSIGTSSLSINIEDPDGDSIDWAIETSPNIGSNSGSNNYNGSKSCSVSGLAYSTTYHWFVSATDGIYWTNGSYSFTTEADLSYTPLGPPSSPPVDNDEQNNPPETPIKPSGPTFVEMGVEYTYSSSTFDVDGDQVRFRFDWGDDNVSDWSDFVVSNTLVSMSYYWSSISTYDVMVIAQDINGSNSSWSPALNVTVSQADLGIPPVVVINVTGNVSVNETIVFNASGSFDPDGFIVSYNWDFGDGETGSGISPVHVYKNPGEYTVTLIVTDNNNNNNTYSKSIFVTVASEVEELESGEQRSGLPFDFVPPLIIGFAIAVLACLAIFFREHIKVFVSTHIIHPFSNVRILHRGHKIEKLDAEIKEINEEIKMMRAKKTVSKPLPVRKMAGFYGEIEEGYIRTDSEVESTGEEKKSFDEFDDFRTGEKIDKLARMELEHDKLPAETRDSGVFKDIESAIDNLILSHESKNLDKFDIEKESMFYDLDIDDIERLVDDLLTLKMREKDEGKD